MCRKNQECYHIDLELVNTNKNREENGAVFRCVLCNKQITDDVWVVDAKGSLPFDQIQRKLTRFYRKEVKKRNEKSRNVWR